MVQATCEMRQAYRKSLPGPIILGSRCTNWRRITNRCGTYYKKYHRLTQKLCVTLLFQASVYTSGVGVCENGVGYICNAIGLLKIIARPYYFRTSLYKMAQDYQPWIYMAQAMKCPGSNSSAQGMEKTQSRPYILKYRRITLELNPVHQWRRLCSAYDLTHRRRV